MSHYRRFVIILGVVVAGECYSQGQLPLDMVVVEGGAFQMGDADGKSNEQPVHTVRVSGFSIGKYEVTQKLWMEIVLWKQGEETKPLNPNPSFVKGENLPVEGISWRDAQIWIGYLNEKEKTTSYRLPTEAEWEYAARGGKLSKGKAYSGSGNVDEVAWHSTDESRPIGEKLANELGIFDMSGNVWEWCQDWYGPYGVDSQADPTGPKRGEYRIRRGGSWNNAAGGCRVSYRSYYAPGRSAPDIGFRLAKDQ